MIQTLQPSFNPYAIQRSSALTSMFGAQPISTSIPTANDNVTLAPLQDEEEECEAEPIPDSSCDLQDISKLMQQVQDLCGQAQELLNHNKLAVKRKNSLERNFDIINQYSNEALQLCHKKERKRVRSSAKKCFFCGNAGSKQYRNVYGTGKFAFKACNRCGLQYRRNPQLADTEIAKRQREIYARLQAASPVFNASFG